MKQICPLLSKPPKEPESPPETQECLKKKCAWYLDTIYNGVCSVKVLGVHFFEEDGWGQT